MKEFKPTDAAMTAKYHDRESAIKRALHIGIGVIVVMAISQVDGRERERKAGER